MNNMMKMVTATMFAVVTTTSGCACEKVPAGSAGIRVNLYGDDKGELQVVPPGVYWTTPREDIFVFPMFEQNPKYTKATDEDAGREVEFQSSEGLQVDADFSITYRVVDPKRVFVTYRRGIEEVNREPLRNLLRDAVGEVGRRMPVEALYGNGATQLVAQAEEKLRTETATVGIEVLRVSLIGPVRLPANVTGALNAKIEATQRAQQRENELREAEAEAAKKVAQARGEAEAELTRARATAEANRVLASSLTRELVEWERTKRWDGKLPSVTTGGSTLLGIEVPR